MQWRDNLRTGLANYPESPTIGNYKRIMMDMLHLNFPQLSEVELAAAIDHSISNHFKDTDVKVDNNYKKITIDMTLRKMADYIIEKEPIITSYGVMFNRHGVLPNPLYELLESFIIGRQSMKREMFKYPKGSEEFAKYNLLQLLFKIDANGYYGATGMYSCIYYNLYAAASVTTQGQSCNSAAALFFESFLNNNVPMSSMNELVEFIYNVLHENHEYRNEEVITNHASLEECFFQLMSSTGFGWIPSENEMFIIWEMLSRLTQDELDRLFYKNNLFNFIDNEPIKQAILYMLQLLNAPFMDPNNPPKEIIDALKEFCGVLKEFVYYDKQIIDRLDKMNALIRTVSAIQDTDSAIISFDGWYQYVRQMCAGIPMTIKNQSVDALDFIENGTVNASETKQIVTEYSFLDDEMIEVDRLIDPMVIIPQDGLRYSIINILAYCTGILVNDYMDKYSRNAHSDNERPCLLTLKNEFLFKRVLITDAKKHYASKMELQEGHIIPEEESLDVKGMDAFVKSSTNAAIRERLKKILYDDILNTENIDQIKILKDIAAIEKEIFDSINSGQKIFFKPVKVKSLSSYENPMRIQGIVASYVYNALHEPGTEALDMSIRNSVDIIKVDMTTKNIGKIQASHPYVYEKALELFKTKEFASGIDAVALPLNEPVPKWVLPFIRYEVIINDNISGFPLKSVGIFQGAETNNSTNIIKF